jgi:hypothetical protein
MTARVAALAALAALLALTAATAHADWELAVHGGPTFPFYEQSFAFDPGPLGLPGGAVVDPQGQYRLDGKGGLSLGAALAFHPHRVVGLEVRLDTADVSVRTGGSRYRVRVALPPPLGTINTDLAFTEGEGDLERLRPVSLNLRLRSPGTTRVTASGGLSYLPVFRFAIRQPIAAGIAGAPLVEVASVVVPAEALPAEEGDGRWGLNGGVGIQHRISARLLLQADGRYFRFQRQTLYWGEPTGTGALTPVQDQLVREITARLDPARFNPTFFQATAGIALSF